MASKVLVPAAPFAKLQVKKSSPEQGGSGFIIGNGDAVARVAHLEHSVRFLQEQHRLMLSGLHAEIEALRERNRDLQFQLIFNKESSSKSSPPAPEEKAENTEEVVNLKKEVSRLELEASAARGEARAAEARALQLQRTIDIQADKLRELEVKASSVCQRSQASSEVGGAPDETRAELRARLCEAERLVRRLRGDAERQRRELQCMKNSLHASLRASGLDGYGYQNNYHFPPLHPTEFWREPLREEYSMAGSRGAGCGTRARRPLTLPELAGQPLPRSTVYANMYVTDHPRPRVNGYDHKKRQPGDPGTNNVDDPQEHYRPDLASTNEIKSRVNVKLVKASIRTYPELKMVVTKLISQDKGSCGPTPEAGRRRRAAPRKHGADHT